MGFNSYLKTSVGTAEQTVFTATSNTTLIGLRAANLLGYDINVTAKITRGATTVTIVPWSVIPANTALSCLDVEKIVMTTGDVLKIVSSDNASCDVIASVLE